jgi:hypothetical protein
MGIQIAKNLTEAVEMGVEHTVDLIRQKLTVMIFNLERGMSSVEAVKLFQTSLGMDGINLSFKEDLEGE